LQEKRGWASIKAGEWRVEEGKEGKRAKSWWKKTRLHPASKSRESLKGGKKKKADAWLEVSQ